ncbi:MAG TPA: NEL-type E3 ubiquitin ligase domain-containing protein [Pseudomonas sp.]|nr:NEL-type E3 ubiquitin ligase domain-containing protein [Pseudomonas sp.]
MQATAQQRTALKNHDASQPDWYRRATPEQRKALNASVTASFTAQTRLEKAMSTFQDIDAFAAPLLSKALKDQFNVELDLEKTLICLKQPLEMGILGIDVSSFEVLKLPLLQAALHNFEASECEAGAFHESSGFVTQTSTPDQFETLKTSLTLTQFLGLCRSLDIGAQYQVYLKGFLHPSDAATEQALRYKFITAQKAALRAAAELALLKKDIEPADYSMILSVINGEVHPQLGGKPVWFRDLTLMKRRMTGCVVFSICEKYRYSNELILYVPNDPQHPLKRYTTNEFEAEFKSRFTTRDASQPWDGSPTAFQRFFSQFVAYADRPHYFSQFTVNATNALQNKGTYTPILNELVKGINPFIGFKKLPPARAVDQLPNDDPYLAPAGVARKGHGIWVDNIDLWDHLFEQHRDKLMADAQAHAVPTADVDARVRSEKLSALLNIGMLVLTAVSMLIPGLGEVMLGVMASQLLYETFEGAIEWSEGDRKAAKAHLSDVAQNLALLVATAGAGKGLAKLTAVKAEPVIESLDPVTLPDGQTRLWKPDLSGYEHPAPIETGAKPNALGQYEVSGKTYIRLDEQFYETTYEASSRQWRIQHPTNPQAYRPVLTHNAAGAWRHTLERPLAWERLKLLRRMGPVTAPFTDEQLLTIGDVSGVSDNALRKAHLDNALPPPELTDALRLFNADRGVAQVIEQIETGQAIDGRYLDCLPWLTELPRWPMGRVLEVFEGPEPVGVSVKYRGARPLPGYKRKAPIQITRAEVLRGELPARILAALDEAEITRLLGGEPARIREARPGELRKQMADFARTRQPAIFESLYKGADAVNPWVAKLQRVCPGLSEPAAQTVLRQASAEEIQRLQTTARVPLHLQEQARWYAQQGRLSQALAGLHLENLASADSKRLALQTLAKLPGWSDEVRLEIREGHPEGLLIEGIGSETAKTRKYLVKNGPFYQAFNGRGESLNSVPGQGDNFYSSILHALPDETRRSLGIPGVGQSAELRRAIIDYASRHPTESTRALHVETTRKPWFKAPQRISEKLVGYPASGHGANNPALVSRVQDIYPGLSDEQALTFLLEQWRLGKTDQQIFTLLANRMREWQELEATLNQWTGGERPTLYAMPDDKAMVAHRIKNAWRNSPRAMESPALATLDLLCDTPLPPLTADFSHIRHLKVGGASLTDTTVNGVLDQFSHVRQLTIVNLWLRKLPEAIDRIPGLTHLSIHSFIHFPAPDIVRLGALTNLESLELQGVLETASAFNVSRLSSLRHLTIGRSYVSGALPIGVLDLPLLERLDVRQMLIRELPVELFDGRHDQLLSGLSLDWSYLNRQAFKSAYEYVQSHAVHLIDREEMVNDHCRGRFELFAGEPGSPPRARGLAQTDLLNDAFLRKWPDAVARYEAIEALSDEYAEFTRQLETWSRRVTTPSSGQLVWTVLPSLKACWYEGLKQRYGLTPHSTVLDLPRMELDELPVLPDQGFSHVTTLHLPGLRAPTEQVRRFVGRFSQAHTLDLSDSNLMESPIADGDLPALEHLNLRNTPLKHLDVSAMTQLKSLSLSGSNLQEWPTGAESLVDLNWLDLRDTQITMLPDTVLSRDSVLISSNLTGTPLTPQSRADLSTALRRVARTQGLADGTLERFARQPVPQVFPPTETGASISRYLLPLLPAQSSDSALSLERRLHRLLPALETDEPRQWIERMRAQGKTDLQLNERISEWNQIHERLTRQMNDWLYVRESRGANWVTSAYNRHLAAVRIMECWRKGLLFEGAAEQALDLNGLQVGDLPELSIAFPHVATLDLTGAGISQQGSNGFLHAFSQLRVLVLNANKLRELPDAVESMSRLERLELDSNSIVDPETLYRSLQAHEQLKYLDVGYNELEAFDASRFARLDTLDLRNNRLTDWPEGVLQHPHLRTLNLSNNDITSVPADALAGAHDELMSGTDLSDNFDLSRDSLERLRDYAQSNGRDEALGLSTYTIQVMLDEFDRESVSDFDSEPESPPSDEDLTGQPSMPEQRQAWFETIEPQAMAEHQALWDQLEAEPDHAAFFHLLSQLRASLEFRVARADLTRRVWEVMRAAGGSTELRQTLFGLSNTHGTCVDGRILTFSGLEVKVFEHNALLDIAPGDLEQKGRALLKLSRQLFRLERVEELATKAPGHRYDAAEARLEYRIGLSQALDLPGQPKNMSFGRPITGKTLTDALKAVQAAEKTDRFYEDLLSRPYWIEYLEEKYPQAFRALETRAAEKTGRLEDEHPDISSTAYSEALESLGIELAIERNQKLIELSRQETGEIEQRASGEPQPGTSKDIQGTHHR